MTSVLAFIFIPMCLWMGITLLGAGVFTTYFGAGKSRTIGAILLVIGLIVAGGTIYTQVGGVMGDAWTIPLFEHVVGIIGTVMGGVIAVAVFLFAIMKS